MPDVFVEIIVFLFLCFSIRSYTVFLIDSFSTTASIIQSTEEISLISSSKFPVFILS